LFDDEPEPIYETAHFFDTSNSFARIFGSTIQSEKNVFGPTALVSQVSYGENVSEGNNWIVDNSSTHHMNGHHNEFFYVTSYGYVDGALVKGLTSNTKAYGIGSYIICHKDESRVFHQTCLKAVLYVPTFSSILKNIQCHLSLFT
jgi:hypothetical protein